MYQHYFVFFFLSSLTGFNFWLNSVLGAVITDNSTAQAVKDILSVNCCGSYSCPSPPACLYTRSFGACYRCSFFYHHPLMHFFVIHHHTPTAKNSRNQMSNRFYPVQQTSNSRNPPTSRFHLSARGDLKWSNME